MTVFCKISVRRSKDGLELLLDDDVKFVDNRSIYVQFSKLILLISYHFLKFIFSHFTLQVRRLVFVEKGNLQFSDSKMRTTEESEKSSLL